MTVTMLELERRLTGFIARHAMLYMGDDDSPAHDGFPLDFMTHENLVLCTAKLYERFNGTVVLRIDAPIGEYDESDDLHRWLATRTGWMPFVLSRAERVGPTRFKVFATHSFLADEVTESEIEQVLGSIDHVAQKWQESLEEASASSDDDDDESALDQPISSRRRDASDSDRFSSPAAIRVTTPEADGTDAVLAELDSLIGLVPVKRLVRQLTAMQQVAQLRNQAGMRAVTPSPHLVFTGNPGTGKTTVARLVGRLYKELGLLSSGHVVEVDRSGLVAGYVGQTALKTREVLETAKGGVLFIDEAYTLNSDHRNDYGSEAIETILAYMENNRGEIAIVVAGYPRQMGEFLQQNPGLASRFDHTLQFPDFDDLELLAVLEGLVAEHDYQLTPDSRAEAARLIAGWSRHEAFGNAREVRRLFNAAVAQHAAAMVRDAVTSGDALRVLDVAHLPEAHESASTPDTLVLPGYL
jgi:AAA+ superfamily predicted ATPase